MSCTTQGSCWTKTNTVTTGHTTTTTTTKNNYNNDYYNTVLTEELIIAALREALAGLCISQQRVFVCVSVCMCIGDLEKSTLCMVWYTRV